MESSSKEEDAAHSAPLSISISREAVGVGSVVGGSLPPHYTPGPSAGVADVPLYPSIAIVMPARVPSPPLLDPAASQLVNVRRVLRTYNDATRARTGKPGNMLARVDIRKSKYWKVLCGAVDALIEHEIPPTSWALFSLDVWKTFHVGNGKRTRPPALSWVWAAKRIEERRGWFRREAGAYMGGRLVFGPRHRYLLTTYDRMRKALHTEDGTAAEIVARYFPANATYDRCVASAREEAEQQTRKFQQRLQRGEFLWG